LRSEPSPPSTISQARERSWKVLSAVSLLILILFLFLFFVGVFGFGKKG